MFKIYKLGELGDFNIETIISLRDSIDFHPVYQRYGGIWSKEKKQLFIDTILNDYDTPKFYFNYFSDSSNPLNSSNKIYAIVDGKQRLEAIFDFLADKFPLSQEFRFYDDENIKLKNLKYSEIAEKHPFILSKFYNYNLDIIFIDTDDEDKLEELFLRLNGGEALTNAEKRNAIGGEFNRKVREIVETHNFFTNKLRFNNPRYQYQDLFIKLALTEYNDELVSFKNNTLYNFIKDNKNFDSNISNVFTKVEDNLNQFKECFNDKDPLLSSKGVLPVFYFFYTRHLPENELFYSFLIEFEEIRKENRKKESSEANPVLVEYDRLNQQGVHLEKSLKLRYKVIEKTFNHFKRFGSLTNFQIEGVPNYEDDENIST